MRLETERLFFRRWEENDAEILYQEASNPEVGPPAGWQPHKSVEESLEIIRSVLNGPEAYAICRKEDGMPIGSIELRLKDKTDLTDKDDECELGYWLARPFWGQGIMPEAAAEMLRHAFEDLGMTKVWCGYYDGNTKSQRVQEKCGFTYQWTTEGLEVKQMNEIRTGHVNMLSKEEWEAQK
ncbi:MAG: GNAT family N-acetyltransferase [Lachnospiraceae bacterium]|nr:GNAT family N-acetyltransferase [Lachnospiraceae bacterium]